jgi:hypothetical protein
MTKYAAASGADATSPVDVSAAAGAHGHSGVKAGRIARILAESAGLLRGPQRLFPLIHSLAHDKIRITFEQRHLYSYTKTKRPTAEALESVVRWILDAQRPDGGIAAYYSLLTGLSESYPEVTGYIIPTLYDFARASGEQCALSAAQHATRWLLSLQMESGAFPGGLQGSDSQPSVFNTGQILQGLVRACAESGSADIRNSAIAAGNWLADTQQSDGSWSGAGAYQESAHTYYSMVAWSLAELAECAADERFGLAAERNLEWVLSYFRPSGWVDGINLRGHPDYLHFIAYALQGVLECAILRRRKDAFEAVEKPAWVLLRKFETGKHLAGAYEQDFKGGRKFSCVTGNAQMSCVWLRLFEVTHDLRYLNAALKMNETLKQLLPSRGRKGIVGGVSGSYPVWGAYQPLRYISWGNKFVADALMMEQRLKREFEGASCAS